MDVKLDRRKDKDGIGRWDCAFDVQDSPASRVVATVEQTTGNEQFWNSAGRVGKVAKWWSTENLRNGCGIGDIFTAKGTATDTGYFHLLYFRSTTDSGRLTGICIGHVVTKNGVTTGSTGLTSHGIVPFVTGDDETMQTALLATGILYGTVPSLPNLGVPWQRVLTHTTTLGEALGYASDALASAGLDDYYASVGKSDDTEGLAVKVGKIKGGNYL